MRLNDSRIRTFKPAKAFNEHKSKVNNLSFFHNGSLLISSGDDDQIAIYDSINGVLSRNLYSKKYGCTLIQFTHSISQAIHGSNKIDDSIRYLSLHDNKYLRYFHGHTKRVVSLNLSPLDDHFISGSLDNTIRLWDLRSPNCQGLLSTGARPVASFDPEGLIFAAGINSDCIKLYDLRTYDKGPFVTFKIPPPSVAGGGDKADSMGSTSAGGGGAAGSDWTKVIFSPNGKFILICSNGPHMRLIDGYKGNVIHTFTVPSNSLAQMPLDATFTPDSAYIMSGSPDGRVHVWNVNTGFKVTTYCPSIDSSVALKPTSCVAFNPKYSLLTTASSTVTFWLPNIEDMD